MRIPVTSDGWKELTVLTVVCAGATVAAAVWLWPVAIAPIALWLWAIWFFRDPERAIANQPDALLAPADGTIVAVEQDQSNEWIAGPALRIDIFLSVFDVHINRSPCAAAVQQVMRRAGRFRNAMRRAAARDNSSTALLLRPAAKLPGPVVVRQIAGMLARRIVCHCRPGELLGAGQRFGMIKFGSRTELIVAADDGWQVVARPGQKVRAGQTVLLRYQPPQRAVGSGGLP